MPRLFLWALLSATVPALAEAQCGDGIVDSAVEQCDDGNLEDGDCCSSSCMAEPVDTPCAVGSLCFVDGSATCDGEGACRGTVPSGCYFTGGRAALFDKAGVNKDQLRFRSSRVSSDFGSEGTGVFGDPTQSTRYEICVHSQGYLYLEGAPKLDYALTVPVGQGWEVDDKGFLFTSAAGAATPVRRVRVAFREHTRGGSTRTRWAMGFNAKGALLDLPGPDSADAYFLDADGDMVQAAGVCVVNDLGRGSGIASQWRGGATYGIGGGLTNQPKLVRFRHWLYD